MKSLFILFNFALAACTACAQAPAQTFTVKAFLPYWNSSTIQLKLNDQVLHTGAVTADMYSYTGNISTTGQGMLEIRKGKTTLFIPLFIEPGTIKIRDKGSNQLEAVGTYSNDEYKAVTARFDSLAKALGTNQLTEIKSFKKKLAATYIQAHQQSAVSLQLLYDHFYLDNAITDTAYFQLYNLLPLSLQQSSMGQKLGREAAISQATATGVKAMNIHLPDTSGALTPFYKEGLTFINFWGSWCIPCRKENKALTNLYNTFHGAGFNITSVSLDTDLQLWKAAIKRDGLQWANLVETGGWSGKATKTYGIKTIPANFLVDASGTIIAQNLTPEQISAFLAQKLGVKTF